MWWAGLRAARYSQQAHLQPRAGHAPCCQVKASSIFDCTWLRPAQARFTTAGCAPFEKAGTGCLSTTTAFIPLGCRQSTLRGCIAHVTSLAIPPSSPERSLNRSLWPSRLHDGFTDLSLCLHSVPLPGDQGAVQGKKYQIELCFEVWDDAFAQFFIVLVNILKPVRTTVCTVAVWGLGAQARV